jgi:hypothetical protein
VRRLIPFVILAAATSTFAQETPTTAPPKPTDPLAEPAIDEERAPPRLDPIAPIPPAELQASINRGVAFLLSDQLDNGAWGSATNTKALNIYAPVPGAHHAFRTATTALCLMALIEVADRDDVKVQQSIERAEDWMFYNLPRLRRADPTAIYNVWGHAYALQALVKMYERVPDDAARRERIVDLMRTQFDYLDRYESANGGWGYYDFDIGAKKPASSPTSFTTATVLFAYWEAKRIGVDPPEKNVQRAIAAIERQKKPDFTYLYGEYLKDVPMMGINRPGGSLGRSQACNLVLQLWGNETVTDDVMVEWLHRLIARNGWLDIGRKRPIPHESWMQVAGYFYYYGHYYAALCIERIPEHERPEIQAHLARIIMDRQEKKGAWFDYELYDYHDQYGTAFALMTLHRCRVK